MKIIYYADNGSMGETSHEDCNRFRAWAKSKLENEYPDDEIEVSSEQHIGEIVCLPDTEDDLAREEEIERFAHDLWDDMEW